MIVISYISVTEAHAHVVDLSVPVRLPMQQEYVILLAGWAVLQLIMSKRAQAAAQRVCAFGCMAAAAIRR